jgi:PelA/Pel-15E family pectate lyase
MKWLLFCCVLLTPGPAAGQTPGSKPAEARLVRIVLVGDSTVTDDSGWGAGFKQLLNERAECVNTAANGRSSKSFIDEGRWQAALDLHADYYLIQFGHNDQPGKGPERETDPATTYRQNMARFVDDARARGAKPILVTSLTRRIFDASGTKIQSTLTPYVEAVKAVAAEKRVPLVDLHARSVELSERLGRQALYEFSPKTETGEYDTTHLNAKGSALFAQLVVDELRRVAPEVARVLRAPSAITWGEVLRQPAAWYQTPDAMRIADNVLVYQRTTGGWPKNIDMARPLSIDDRATLTAEQALTDSTIDNGATVTQLRVLARVYGATREERFHAAVLKGLDYVLAAQYPNGGWPQFFPLRDGYWSHITFNDGAMIGVMGLLRDVSAGRAPVDFVDAARRARASQAVERAVAVTLRMQIRVAGRLTGWCQQYDERTLEPAGARTYEHPSIASQETVGIVRFLMAADAPTPAMVSAIDGAVAWLRRAALHGVRLDRRPDPAAPGGFDLVVADDPAATPLWARFYEIATDRPIYSGRDGLIKYRLSEIEIERRTGYSWLGPYATALLDSEYDGWAARVRRGARAASI